MQMKLKKTLSGLLAAAMLLSLGTIEAMAEVDVTELYVAANGSDQNPGTIEKPYATVEAARDKIRELKKSGSLGKNGAAVYIRGGEYNILETIELTAEDSGTEEAPIVYRAYRDEEVTFIGGIHIPAEKFEKISDEAKARVVDKGAAQKIKQVSLYDLGVTEIAEPFWPGSYSYWPGMQKITGNKGGAAASELFINGESMTISQYPNEDFMNVKTVVEAGASPRNWEDDKIGGAEYVEEADRKPTPFTIVPDDNRLKYWTEAKDALIYGRFMHDWADQTVPLASVDPDANTITSKFPSYYGMDVNRPFRVTNLLEEIDIANEYYIDRQTGILYVYPPEAGIKDAILSLNDGPIMLLSETEYVTVKNIDFTAGRSFGIKLFKGSNNVIDGCELSLFASFGIYIYDAKNSGAINCYIHNNNGGVDIYGGVRETLEEGGNYIENSELAHNDRITKTYMPSIKLRGCGNRVSHCKIHGSEHDIIEFNGNEHRIEYNEIYDAVQNTDDMGAIYTCRDVTYKGNKIMYNYIHDIGGDSLGEYGTQAIFLDDFMSSALIAGNVFEDIMGASVKLAGADNIILNNMFINSPYASASIDVARSYAYGSTTTAEPTLLQSLKNMPIDSDLWKERYPELLTYANEDFTQMLKVGTNIVLGYNLFYNAKGINISLEIGQDAVQVNNVSFNEDPGFYDYENGNYLLKQDAEAYTKIEGFQPIPFTRMGMYSERAAKRVNEAVAYAKNSGYAMVNGSKREISEDFAVRTFEENGAAYIPVRFTAESTKSEVSYDAESGDVTLSGSRVTAVIKGDRTTVTSNGEAVELSQPIKNIDGTLYMAAEDAAAMLGLQLYSGAVTVLSTTEELFTSADGDITSWLAGQLSER